MRIGTAVFQGMRPRIEDRLLQESQAVTAQNVELLGGILTAIKEPLEVKTLPDTARVSIYPYNSDWLSWTTDVDVVPGPLKDDQYDRIYYTGAGSPKIRGIDGGSEEEWDLGLPAPTNAPSCASQAKGSVTWTRTWKYQYEEPNLQINESGSLTEGVDITEVTAGKVYTLNSIPARGAASDDAKLIIYFDPAEDANGFDLGKLYPAQSAFDVANDFYLQGAKGTATFTHNASTGTFTISYNTDRAQDYKVERFYVYTFVSDWGEEGPPSPVSAEVAIDPAQNCVLTNFDTTSTHGNVTAIRIYRTQTTDAGTNYYYVDEISLGTTTYTDSNTDSELGEAIPSVGWIAPDSGLSGLTALPGGLMAAFKGKTVHFCVPYYPHAWPIAYQINVENNIVGMEASSSGLVVTTEGAPYLLAGAHPLIMEVIRIDSRQPCVSKRSVAVGGETGAKVVVYASPDGLVVVEGAGARVFTEQYYRFEEWDTLNPSTMIGEVHDGKYYGFTDTHAIIFNFSEGDSALSITDETATGLHSDLLTDTLYLIQGDKIVSWRKGVNNLTLTWKSREYPVPRQRSFSVGVMRAGSYPQTVNVYADGALAFTKTVASGDGFRFPQARDSVKWQYEIVANDDVHEFWMANEMWEVR